MTENELTQLMGTFCKRFLQRTEAYSLLDMGEDSVRYDFFLAVMEVFGKESYEIRLEKAITEGAFNLNNTKGSKRKEKPKLDLSFTLDEREHNFEFGLFRRNSNLEGPINTTERFGKFLNDAVRLSNYSTVQSSIGYLVYVADDKFIDYEPKPLGFNQFPADFYSLIPKGYAELPKSTTKAIDQRFLTKAGELQYYPRLVKKFERYMQDRAEKKYVVVCYEVEPLPSMS